MTQMYGNNIGNVNMEKSGPSYNTAGSGTAGRSVKAYGAAGNDEVLGYKYNKDDMTSQVKKSISDGFEEYMRSVQEREKEENIDEAARDREQRKNEREIAGNLTHDEIARLSMMGIDVESAKLSDIMGLVNTIRGEAHREETQRLMAKITMSEDISDGAMVTGGSVVSTVSGVELDDVDVADVMVSKQQDGEEPKENIDFTKDDFIYLVKNNLDAYQENLYKAHFSGSKAVTEYDDELFESMRPQLERVILQAGYAVEAESLEGARLILSNELPINTDNIRKYMSLKDFFGRDMSYVKAAGDRPDERALAEKLYEDINSIEPETVYEMSMKGLEVTIASARSYGAWKGEHIQGNKVPGERISGEVRDAAGIKDTDPEIKAVANMRILEELRLSMTMDAAARMIKLDINIDTRELSQVVAKLKAMETRLIEDSLKRNGVEPTGENVALINEISDKINSLSNAPAAVIAVPLTDSRFTVNALNEAVGYNTDVSGKESSGKAFETARRSYEAAETEVRTDLGDSISKAFSNVDDILVELGLSADYENRRAVRILGYNKLDITEQNIKDIVNYDRQVNTLIDSFYPEAVMGIIKDGINPLDMPIDELNRIIAERNYNQGVTEAENFATYLRNIEKLGEISPEERESYIGIYRIMEKLSKSGDREAGWVYGNGSRLNLRNLIAAARSRRAVGINAGIDDDFGLLEELQVKGSRIDAQIESAFAKLDGINMEEGDNQGDTRLHEGLEALNDEMVEAFMKEQQIDSTIVNARAVFTMLNQTGGIYGLVSEILSKMKFTSDTKENAVDEETDNMAKSLTGSEIENSISMEIILESIGGESLPLKYDELRDRLTTMMYASAMVGTISSRDIASIKTVMAGFNIMGNMARNDYYQIPYETERGMSVMRLTIMHDEGRRGNINIQLESPDYGQLEANLRLADENSFEGSIVASGSEGNVLLMENRQRISDSFEAAGYSAERVSFGQQPENRDAAVAFREGRALYRAAVTATRIMTTI